MTNDVNKQSWSLATLHSGAQAIEVVAGNVEGVLGVSEQRLSETGVAGLVVGDLPSPCPWTQTCESAVYLIRSGSDACRWIESRTVAVGDDKFLMSSRTLSTGLLSDDLFAVITRLCLAGSLLGPLAHELNNIVQGLTSAEYLIRDSLECNEPVEMEDVDQLAQTLTALKQMGAAIQGFARTTGFEVQLVDFPGTLECVIKFLTSLGKLSTVELKVEVPDQFPDMHWNKGYLELILKALLCNAAEATQATLENAPRAVISVVCIGDLVELRVCNTAGEIDISRCQVPGVSTRPSHRHAGLGLSAVAQIISECGGTMALTTYDSLPGLLLTLPLDARKSL